MQKNHQKSGFVQFCYSFGLLFYSIIVFFSLLCTANLLREIIKKKGSTDFVRGLPTQKLLAKYRRATVHYSK